MILHSEGWKFIRTGAGTLLFDHVPYSSCKESKNNTLYSFHVFHLFGKHSFFRAKFSTTGDCPFLLCLLSYLQKGNNNCGTGKKRNAAKRTSPTTAKRNFAMPFQNIGRAMRFATVISGQCIAPKEISHIRSRKSEGNVLCVRGFMDYLHFLL